MTHVLLVAAYATVRAGLFALLTGTEECVVVGQASGSGDLRCLLPDLRPDVVLLDAPPGEAARVIPLLAGGPAGLVLLGDDPEDGRRLTGGGLSSWAWLRKDAGAAEIAAAVRAVTAGLVTVDPALLPFLTDPAAPVPDVTFAGETPTIREREVLQLMAQGLPNKQIAARLGISPHTVKFHVAALLSKLSAASRTEAVTQGMRQGWVLL